MISGVSDKGLITVESEAHHFNNLDTEDFLLEILYKMRNKASCHELQAMQEWDRKERREQRS